jgi:hypothetical protein
MPFSFPAAFKNLGHFIASGAKGFVAFGREADVLLAKAQGEKPLIEAVTRIVSPQAAEVEDTAFYALGVLGQALDGIESAVAGKGVNVALDQDAYNKITSAIAVVKHPVVAQKTA